jgi:hypothetical protein
LDFEKSYVVISFKIFSALSWEKELKNWKSNFLYWLNVAALMNLRRWTQCSSDCKRKLSNGELMQTHEELSLLCGNQRKNAVIKKHRYRIAFRHFTVKPL